MAEYALKKEKKKSKAPCVVCMVLYLIVALAICASYAARGGTAGSLKYKVLIKGTRPIIPHSLKPKIPESETRGYISR